MTEQQQITHTPEVIIDQSTLGLPHNIRPMYDMLVREGDIIVGTLQGTERRVVDIGGQNNPWDFRVLQDTPAETRAAREARTAQPTGNAIDNSNL